MGEEGTPSGEIPELPDSVSDSDDLDSSDHQQQIRRMLSFAREHKRRADEAETALSGERARAERAEAALAKKASKKLSPSDRIANGLKGFAFPYVVAAYPAAWLVTNKKKVGAGFAGVIMMSQVWGAMVSLSPNTILYRMPFCHAWFKPHLVINQEPDRPGADQPIGVNGVYLRPPSDTSPNTVAVPGSPKQAFYTISDPCERDLFTFFGKPVLEQRPLDSVKVTMEAVASPAYSPPDFAKHVQMDTSGDNKSKDFLSNPDTKQDGNRVTFKNTETGTGGTIVQVDDQITKPGQHDTYRMMMDFNHHPEEVGRVTIDTKRADDPSTFGIIQYLMWKGQLLPNAFIDGVNQKIKDFDGKIRDVEAWIKQYIWPYVPDVVKNNWPQMPDQIDLALPHLQLDELGRQADSEIQIGQHLAQDQIKKVIEIKITEACAQTVGCNTHGQGDRSGQGDHGKIIE
jgi:hypothetical protein